jgi:hypothetical protein
VVAHSLCARAIDPFDHFASVHRPTRRTHALRKTLTLKIVESATAMTEPSQTPIAYCTARVHSFTAVRRLPRLWPTSDKATPIAAKTDLPRGTQFSPSWKWTVKHSAHTSEETKCDDRAFALLRLRALRVWEEVVRQVIEKALNIRQSVWMDI